MKNVDDRIRALAESRTDQNTGGALLEFPVRTAMHWKPGVSSAIKEAEK